MSRGAKLKVRKPSAAQERALSKLSTKWQCAYELKESLNVLDGLVKRGVAMVQYLPGSTAFPRTSIEYKLNVNLRS